MDGCSESHEHLVPCVRKSESHQATADEDSGRQQNRDRFGYTHQGAEDQISKYRSSFAQGIQESESCGSVERNQRTLF